MPPARKQSAASSSKSSGPKPFDFKSVHRDKGGGGGVRGGNKHGNDGSGAQHSARPTKTRVHKCVFQDGHERAGEYSDNRDFVFDPRWGLNKEAKEVVAPLTYGKDEVKGFNKSLQGFHVRVHVPKQAVRMHNALRVLDPALPETLDLGDWEEPELTAAKLTNLNVPATRHNPNAYEGVTATMINGYTYPLYKQMRRLKFDYVRDVHNKEGVDRWVRIHEDKEDVAKMQQELQTMLEEEGWRVNFAAGNAAEWGDDDDEE